MENEYNVKTWLELFSEISYAFDRDYKPDFYTQDGIEYISFYKLYLNSKGQASYKVDDWTFDPALWPRVKLLYKLFEENNAIDVLYGK